MLLAIAGKACGTGVVTEGALNDTAGAAGATAGVDGVVDAVCAKMFVGAGALGVSSSACAGDGCEN